ncbi:phosphotransferase [Marisediminicola sp. LYQ134]|uniref:phosphotransferase n=1 Tax=Marisediminicola sp. LYQ134 TaxID=3391061 RepID=UPI003982E659
MTDRDADPHVSQRTDASATPPPITSLAGLLFGLAEAIALEAPQFGGGVLDPLTDSGLAHHHVRLGDHGVLARIPKQSQMQLDAHANLDYQAACFERAGASGRTPRLVGVLRPRPTLPRGALLVEHIVGRPAELPADLPQIAETLARIHALPVPQPGSRPPLGDAPDPLAALDDEVRAHALHLDDAMIAAPARAVIDRELDRLGALVARADRPAKRLIAFDAHPGNFVVRADGSAVLVDLEKCRYSYAPLDLAHATLYTSTTWEPGATVALSTDQLVEFSRDWSAVVAPAGDEEWLAPLRRAMWLWSVTWCAKWRVLSSASAASTPDGEDWSAANSDPAVTSHVRGRVDHYLDPAVIETIVAGFDEFDLRVASS